MRTKRQPTLSPAEAREVVDALEACRAVLTRMSARIDACGADYVALSASVTACSKSAETIRNAHDLDRDRHVSFMGRL